MKRYLGLFAALVGVMAFGVGALGRTTTGPWPAKYIQINRVTLLPVTDSMLSLEIQWGHATPQDLQWLEFTGHTMPDPIIYKVPVNQRRLTIVVPRAGLGQQFVDEICQVNVWHTLQAPRVCVTRLNQRGVWEPITDAPMPQPAGAYFSVVSVLPDATPVEVRGCVAAADSMRLNYLTLMAATVAGAPLTVPPACIPLFGLRDVICAAVVDSGDRPHVISWPASASCQKWYDRLRGAIP